MHRIAKSIPPFDEGTVTESFAAATGPSAVGAASGGRDRGPLAGAGTQRQLLLELAPWGGKTPLMNAARYGKVAEARQFIELGADPKVAVT